VLFGNNRQWLTAQFPEGKPLVILHPNFIAQHLLNPLAFNRADGSTVFMALTSASASLPEVWALSAAVFSEQLDCDLPVFNARWKVEDAAQAFLKAIKPLASFCWLIEAFDLADETVQQWIVLIAANLSSKAQIVLNTRNLPHTLVNAPAMQGKAVLFPIDPERMLIDYLVNTSPDEHVIEVFALGPGRAMIDGHTIDHWDGVLPRSLFFFIVDRGMATRDDIFNTFWPSLSIKEATNVFHVTKRKISEILGFDLTEYSSGYYRLATPVTLHYDVAKFMENVHGSEADDESSEAIVMLERAAYLYRGEFLSGLNVDWANARRVEIAQMHTDALALLGRLRQNEGQYQEALGLYARAASNHPQREDLVRAVMSILAELGQKKEALRVYERLRSDLKAQFGVEPDPATVDLARKIQNS